MISENQTSRLCYHNCKTTTAMDVCFSNYEKSLKRSKSMCSLSSHSPVYINIKNGRTTSLSESSVEIALVPSVDGSSSEELNTKVDSSLEKTCISSEEVFMMLDHKIDNLSDLYLEQCRQLTEIKEDILRSKMSMRRTEHVHSKLVTDALLKTLAQRLTELESVILSEPAGEEVDTNSRAKSLLNAIEMRRHFSIDHEIRDALVDFLQSDELKNHIVSKTTDAVKEVVRGNFSRDVSTIYLPVLERSHRRLAQTVSGVLEQAFMDLEENSEALSRSMFRTTKMLRRALEKHQRTMEVAVSPSRIAGQLECTMEDVLKKELKQWRNKVVQVFAEDVQIDEEEESGCQPLDYLCPSPPQPADPEHSAIDQLMHAAQINKLISDGDVNGAFAHSLSAGNLSLVMMACRAVDPGFLFRSPCTLDQCVVLSLIQQLATDMVHETQIKCRYLEEAIISLSPYDLGIRPHLPLVVGEVRQHLTRFLTSYPSHTANRRIKLIVMAVENLLR